jgi:branched-chain amino acid transport system substrate-binding protein
MVNDDRNSRTSESTGNETDLNPNSGSIDRRRFLQATRTGAAAVTVAGCVESGDGDGGGDGSGDGGGTDTGGSDGDGGDGGNGGDGGGSDLPDTITVGALGAADSPMGASIFNAVEIAANEINENGGIDGSDVEIVTKDTMDDPSTTREVYQELTTGENVNATVGIFGSENLLSIMGNIAQAQTVHLTTGAATPEAPRQVEENYEQHKYWFRVGRRTRRSWPTRWSPTRRTGSRRWAGRRWRSSRRTTSGRSRRRRTSSSA